MRKDKKQKVGPALRRGPCAPTGRFMIAQGEALELHGETQKEMREAKRTPRPASTPPTILK